MKNREKILGMISLTAGILFLAVMIFNSVMAVKGLSEEYQKVINYNGTEEVILSLSYDDGFYGSVGFGMTPEVGRQSVMTEVSLFARNSQKDHLLRDHLYIVRGIPDGIRSVCGRKG